MTENTGYSSSNIVSEKASVTTAKKSIISYQEEKVITEEVIGSNLVEESSKILERDHNSSSLESFHSQ
jgi:hypothetical protein